MNKDQVHKKAAASRPLVSLHEIIGSGCALFYFDKSCFVYIKCIENDSLSVRHSVRRACHWVYSMLCALLYQYINIEYINIEFPVRFSVRRGE